MSSYKHFDPKVIKKRKKYRTKSAHTRFEMYILKTNRHIVAVLYDKQEARDVAAVSTRPVSFKHAENRSMDAFQIGKSFAEICKSRQIQDLYFNKLSYKFHGIIAETVRGVRESGINI